MQAPKWYVIGKNQYRLTLSGVREVRPYFPYLAIGLLALYVAYLAPAIVGSFTDEALEFLLSQAAVATIQLILFSIFLWFIFFPVSLVLRDIQISQLEIFLSAPVKPSHLLLGEFLGVLPFYAIGVVVIAGVFTALVNPLGLGVLQTAIVVMVFVLTFFSALWLGTVAGALLRTKLGQSDRGRDIGKAIGFLIALPVVAVMYAMMGGGLATVLSDPGASGLVRSALGLLPSSWGARLITDFAANPGNISAVWFETLTRFGGLTLFFLASLWLGVKLADRAYNLETTSFSAAKAKSDGAFYNALRSFVGGGAFGTLVVSIFKDYGRRLQNLSRVGYIMGIIVLINVFLVRPDEPFGMFLMGQALFGVLAAFVVGEVTVRGKECLFIYRKAPRGESRLVKARLAQGWIVTLPIAAALTAAQLAIVPRISPLAALGYIAVLVVLAAAYVVLTLGLFLLMPAFSDKGGEFGVIMMVIPMLSFGSFIASDILLGRAWSGPFVVVLSWLVGILLLVLGKRNLGRIE